MSRQEDQTTKNGASTIGMFGERSDAAILKFLATANHDLRQPLHAMSLFVSALNERANSNPNQPVSEFIGLLEKISKSQKTVEELWENLLDFSKLDSGVTRIAPQVFQVGVLFDRMQECFQPAVQQRGLQLSVVPCSLLVHTDRLLMERLIDCLMSNAIKFTSAGKILVGARRQRGRVTIQVWDTGVGVPADQKDGVFEPFAKGGASEFGQMPGLGLGLAIVASIAQQLDGQLEVRSQPGRGSCFSVSLPMAGKEEKDAQERHKHTTERPKPPVLVIDDDSSVLEAMEMLFDGWGIPMIGAETLEEAREKAARAEEKPSLLIASYQLGNDSNGFDAIKILRADLGEEVAAALVTEGTDTVLAREAQKHGMVSLHKPIKPSQLGQLVRSAVAGGLI